MSADFHLRFSIQGWHAASTRLHTGEEWAAWTSGRLNAAELPDTPPKVDFLPAMQRRRLGLSARLLFAAAHPLLADGETCPLVLASHDGEINRSFGLWTTLLRDNEVSPTSFGLSVHNALAGQWSMLRGDMSENTALSVRQSGLETAVLEAAGLLADGAERVLAVVVDEPLQAQYPAAPAERAPFAHALALLLTAGGEWELSPAAYNIENVADIGYWGALEWLRQRFSGSREWVNQYADEAWQWRRLTP
ncbi:beta-ketoacyl synthase chain length factor [Eikenella sp. S3360]|uniref:Beta-ketoacyl synthase chain length factor n=1 Tax=Eikenella glucosivorans TaxID=2766967 RepID=A0ABS0N7J9_9NEIS|nr:beta-ketoacyl synthase chain length factor [Eikenella glucosivorans]MBH5328266.1 beta-ketoacyl synthase chain length factor [Eikenella glucosivorans]